MKTLLSRRLLSIPAVLLLTLILTVNVMAETYTATTMRLLRYEGKVEIQDSSGKSSLVMENIRLNSGDSLQTGAGSSASVGLDSAKIVTLDENTKVEFTKQAKEMKLSLVEGSFLLDVSEKLNKDESLDIRTSTMAVGIRGTVVLVSTYPIDEYQKKLSQKMSDAQTSAAADTSLSDLEEKIMQSSDGGGVVSVLGVLEGKVELVYQDESGKSTKLEVSGGQKATLLDANENDMVDIKPEVDKVTYADIFSAADREIQNDPDLQKRLRDADFDIPDNSKVDPNYPADGDWTISSPVTVIAQSASKMFDGQPLTRTSDILVQGLPSGLTFRASAGGSQTDAGSGDNPVSSFEIYNQKGENVTRHFTNIQKVPGKLTVDPAPLTAWTASVTKVYDGKPLTSPETKLTFSPGYERNSARKNLSYVIAENGSTAYSRSTNSKSNKAGSSAATNKPVAYTGVSTYGASVTSNSAVTANYVVTGNRTLTYNAPADNISSVAGKKTVTGNRNAAINRTITEFRYVTSGGSEAGSESAAGQTSDLYDTQTLYGICGVVLVHGSNPITEEIKEINLSAGEKLTVHLSDENNEASIEYVIEKITEDEIPDEILRIYADNPDVLAQACTETGWSAKKVTERIKQLPPLEFKSSEVNGVKVDSRNAEDLMEDCTNVRITIDTEGADYNDRALNEEEAHYTPMKADPSIRIVLNSSLTDVGTAQSTFSIDWGNANPDNYNLNIEPGTLTITPASAIVTTGSAEKEYDGTPLTSSEASISGLVNNETATVVTTGSITDVGTADNTYTINWGTAKADNYTLTANVGTLKIIGSQTGITFKAPSDSKTYDGTPLEAGAVTVTGLPRGYTFAATASGSQTDAGSSETTVTSYKIFDRGGKDVTASFTNIKTENGTLTVNPAAVTVTTGSASREYDGTPLSNTEASISGLADADKDAVTVTATGSITKVGTAENTYTISWGEAKSSNYTLSESIGTLEVTANDTAVTIKAASSSKSYDGTALTDTSFTVDGELPANHSAACEVTGSQTDAGSSANTISSYKILNADGEDVTEYFTKITTEDGTLTVNRAAVTITTDSITKEYDGAPLNGTVSITGLADADKKKVTITATASITEVGTTESTYTFSWGTADSSNYTLSENIGTLEVTKNNKEITFTSASAEKVYDGTPLIASIVTVEGLPEGLTYVSSAGSTFTIIDAGTGPNYFDDMEYTFTNENGETMIGWRYAVIKDADGKDVTDNFTNIKLVQGTLTVKPVTLSINLGSPHYTYNGETHGGSLTVKYENGPNTGETIEPYWSNENYNGIINSRYNVSPDADITVTAGNGGPDAGTYTLSCTTDFTAGKPENYKINVTGDELIIDPKSVPVETGSATEAYDASNPNKPVTNSTAAIYNLVGSDQDLVTITATGSQIEVGSSENTYSINWNGVNSMNYTIVEHLGTLTKTRPTMGSLGFRDRLKNKIKDSFEKATESSGDKQESADSSAVRDPKAGDDSKPAANQSGDNTGSNTTSDSKVEKSDQTSAGTGKTADSSGESKKDEASSDDGKDGSGKTESEKTGSEKTESMKSEETGSEKPEKTESAQAEPEKPEKTESAQAEPEKPEKTESAQAGPEKPEKTELAQAGPEKPEKTESAQPESE